MSKVKVGGIEGKIDELDGEMLLDGEIVEVTWPDQTLESTRVHVYSTSELTGHVGSDLRRIPVRQSFMRIFNHGLEIEISLKRFENVTRQGVSSA